MSSIRSIRKRGQRQVAAAQLDRWLQGLVRMAVNRRMDAVWHSALRKASHRHSIISTPFEVGCGVGAAPDMCTVSVLSPDGWKVLGVTPGPLSWSGAPRRV